MIQAWTIFLLFTMGTKLMAENIQTIVDPPLSIKINVENVKSARGSILISIFSDPKHFPRAADRAVKTAKVSAKVGVTEVLITGLKPGEYAIALLHDANDNGKMDTNFLGKPREGFGFSNNAMGRFGPPDFGRAKFTLDQDRDVSIRLKHF